MENVSWIAIVLPTVLTIAFRLAKAGFLLWVFIRTQKAWAIGYAVYVLVASFANFVLPAAISSVVASGSPASVQSTFAIYGAVTTLIEVVLFVGLIQSLLKSPRSMVQAPPADGV